MINQNSIQDKAWDQDVYAVGDAPQFEQQYEVREAAYDCTCTRKAWV
jgi:hypothetical protein